MMQRGFSSSHEASEFIQLARAIVRSRGIISDAVVKAETARAPRAAAILRSAVDIGTTADPDFASSIYQYDVLASAFLASLRGVGAFDSMLGSMRQVPLKTYVLVVTSGISGHAVAQSAPKPVSRLSLEARGLQPMKATGQVIISEELMESASQILFAAELRSAVVAATDEQFVAGLTDSGTSSVAATGTDAAAVLADIASAAAQMRMHARSRLFLLADPQTVMRLALLADDTGARAFPDLTVFGGEIGGIGVIATDAIIAAGDLLVVDGYQLAAGDQTVTLDISRQASVQIDDAPANPAVAATVLTSLWQNGLCALLAHRWFAFQRLGDSAVVSITGANYGGASSP